MRMVHQIGLAMAVVWLAGCRERAAPVESPAVETQTERHRFAVRGLITEIKPDGRTAMVNHEAIPGYMQSMTMPLRVRDSRELAGFEVGNAISFELVVTDEAGWIEKLKRIDRAGLQIVETADYLIDAGPARSGPDIPPLEIGDFAPDVTLTNHLGQAFTLREFEGNALGLTFIYTRCPFPEFCPRMTTNFAKISEILAVVPEPRNWRLLTVSFDPDFDTPQVLNVYAKRHSPHESRWSFATGSKEAIQEVTQRSGIGITPMPTGVGWDHNFRAVVINAQGRVQRIFTGNTWTPVEFAMEMYQAMRSLPEPETSQLSDESDADSRSDR